MAELMTIQFPNTPEGQLQKNQKLSELYAEGWRVVSETISGGEFKKEKACCFFMIFPPCAFLAGSTPGAINVTLTKDNEDEKPAKPILSLQEGYASRSVSVTEGTKKCPACAELIKEGAKKCRYCGEMIASWESEKMSSARRNTCPKCKYERQPKDDAHTPKGLCPKCGAVYAK